MKDEILNILDMKDILDKYGIKQKGYMFHCPLHGIDKNPSAKCYKKSYYCFSCGNNGDLIDFVEKYFNLNFQEAMEKINFDFNLGLKTRGRLSKKQLFQLQKQQQIKKQKEEYRKQLITKKLIKASNHYKIYNNIIYNLKKEITKDNWEEKVETIAFLQDKIELLDLYMEELLNKKN